MPPANPNKAKRTAPLNKSVFVLLAAGTDPAVVKGVATNANDAMAVMEKEGTTSYKKFNIQKRPRAVKGSTATA